MEGMYCQYPLFASFRIGMDIEILTCQEGGRRGVSLPAGGCYSLPDRMMEMISQRPRKKAKPKALMASTEKPKIFGPTPVV